MWAGPFGVWAPSCGERGGAARVARGGRSLLFAGQGRGTVVSWRFLGLWRGCTRHRLPSEVMTMADTGGGDQSKELPVEQLKEAGRDLVQALMVRAITGASGKIQDMTQRLTDAADGGDTGTKMAAAGAKKLAEGESPL